MKSLLVSRTFWLNVVSLIATISTIWGFQLPPELQNEIVTAILLIVNFGNIALRFITTKAVYLFKKPL